MDTAKKAKGAFKKKGTLTAKVEKPQKVPEDNKDSQSDDAVMQEDESDASSMSGGDTTDAESDYEAMAKKRKQELKKNRTKTAEPEEFADILSSILAQDARSDWKAPIMAKDKTRERMIKEEKLNYRARKALAEEKRLVLSKDRVIPTFESMNYERGLRKVATKGVIKLFNVVKAQQAELSTINATQTTQTEKVSEMSKSKFLDLLKAKTS
ncbi:pre-60S ribosomal particles component [Coemansia sp. RSA 1813]|nr:pre-60S ribosomal particles component [Coemansia sp. RSA 1646]KAJ1765048.1 pre-60S ribosomal particles component [Coemansia sp. RSA 1843]KAJ2090286.1 pre-60S ribosomal particles component [Coemansia sp. RSA 986]KAJ2215476.1 pre-60S ribosomal particles component [Coemansia sp. RSA 487]KAJ2566071.1 pre-60S ribosomal particles component [Coemansia sp. RSA 1813]